METHQLVFLKLGGSLITEKTKPLTSRLDVIQRIANEIAQALEATPDLQLLIGHGSGSFGHTVASQYQTQAGGRSKDYWRGFAKVWRAARQLNQVVVEQLSQASIPVIAFPPSSGVITRGKQIQTWDTSPIQSALERSLIPVIYGDVVFDTQLGGTILSTEHLFQHLARVFSPNRVLLAGLDTGVYYNANQPTEIIPLITPRNFEEMLPALSTSHAVDVTGGMRTKVELMVALVNENTELKIHIFSGNEPSNLFTALTSPMTTPGTLISW